MTKRTARLIKWILLILSMSAVLIFFFLFSSYSLIHKNLDYAENGYNTEDNRLYHVIVTGTYENQNFLSSVFAGASSIAPQYNAIVDLVVPQSQADTSSLQNLLDYCSYLNADGIIVYVDSPAENFSILQKNDSPFIPVITTGQFSPDINQISFIGINNWELGKKIAEEIKPYTTPQSSVFIISDSTSANTTNIISSFQRTLQETSGIKSEVIKNLSRDFEFSEEENVFITLEEEDTILTARTLAEQFPEKNCTLIGSGGNEVCQLYMQKGWIDMLFSLNPEKIGEEAVRELFEFRNKGYANSYITADVMITKSGEKR